MRLIDADALKDKARELIPDYHAAVVMNLFDLFDALADNTPTIDAVPVVRCKDCKHYSGGTWHPDDFSSYWERSEDDNA